MTYTIPRPTLSAVFWLLAAATLAALAGLMWSAWGAFALVGDKTHAFLLASAIEVSAALEAIAFARARKWHDYIAPIIGVLVSVIISGIYNYANVEAAGRANKITHPIYLSALALGPLFAMIFLSINTGVLFREWESAVEKWAMKRQEWTTQQAQRTDALNRSDADTARSDQLRREREQRESEERNAQRAHELQLAELAQQTQFANASDGQRKQPKPRKARKPQGETAQRVAQWRADNPQWAGKEGEKKACAEALGIHPSNVGRNWK